jgi:two-component system OmpR family response regulator/two-component system response regulator QseB
MTAICPCCGYDIARDEPLERAGIAMAPYGPVRFHGADVKLTRGESAVLRTLMKANGRPIPRHVLAERYGQKETSDSNSVDVLLTRIKQKLARHGAHPIQNRRGVGVYIEA